MSTNIVGDTEELSIQNPGENIQEYLKEEGHFEGIPKGAVLEVLSVIAHKSGTLVRLGLRDRKKD